MRFWQNVMVKTEYSSGIFFTATVQPNVASIATPSSISPSGETCMLRLMSKVIIATPITESTMPTMLSFEILSFRKMQATIGVKSGIVPIIIPAVEASTFVSPFVSPRKYRKGSKKASTMNNGKCLSLIFMRFFAMSSTSNRITEATIVRKYMIVIGLQHTSARFAQMNENDQNSIAIISNGQIIIGESFFTGAKIISLLIARNYFVIFAQQDDFLKSLAMPIRNFV